MKTLDGKKVSKAGEYSFDIVETNASGDALEGEAPQSVSNDNTGRRALFLMMDTKVMTEIHLSQ